MARLSEERVPAQFPGLASELRVMARVLNDYLRESDADVGGSPAQIEYADEPAYSQCHLD